MIDESQEISIGEVENWTEKLLSAFPALKHKNYQLYFFGQLISLIGMWLQRVAQGWLIFQLTNSAFWVGTVTGLSTLPILIFGLFGGVIVDRFPKKRILYFTQSSSMILAFLLGIFTIAGNANVINISILAFMLGIVDAIDKPARQSFAVEMVGKEDLDSAIALNSGIFNAARVLGPASAGILIAFFGTGLAFILNAISFIPVIIALYYIRIKETLPKSNPHPLLAIKEGLIYSYLHKPIRNLLIFSGFVSIFGWSHITIMPVIAKNSFQADAQGLGYLYAFSGLGAFIGAIFISAYSKKINYIKFIIVGNILFSIPIIIFSFTNNLIVAFPFLFLSGLGLIMQFSVINSAIQHMVDDKIRGRVMSIYVLMAIGTSPIGSFQIGLIADNFGTFIAISAGAIIMLISGFLLFMNMVNVNTKYELTPSR
ncbi:MAG: MFS transporter [Candidatus Levybacteria bacterium]|nr:MFS transporter [Candidatus Levybacteria bacterium]